MIHNMWIEFKLNNNQLEILERIEFLWSHKLREKKFWWITDDEQFLINNGFVLWNIFWGNIVSITKKI